jgi:large subunit ribosomal protein L15
VKAHELVPDSGARRPRKRVARGNSGSGGTYAGRGRKGQGARSGEGRKPYFEGGQLPFVRRLPFRRGFTRLWKTTYAPINLAALESCFRAGDEVTPEALAAAGLLRSPAEPYKVLGGGGLEVALTVRAPRFSASARAAIEAAGGSCVIVPETVPDRPLLARPHPRR